MSGTLKRLAGPAYLSNSAADVLAAPASGTRYIVRHIHIANEDSSARTFSLFLGATGGSSGGTSLFPTKSIPANDVYDWYCYLEMTSSDYLSGLASVASKLVITVAGEKQYL